MDSGTSVVQAVEIINLNYNYPDGKQALKGINFRLARNETIGIIGPNGAGKTTLLLQLNGILQGKGNISIMGLPLVSGNLKKIRAKIGLVFQDPDDQLFSSTVYDDVSFGPVNMELSVEEVNRRTLEALTLVGMENYSARSSHHLSFGEKKRVSIATVLSMKPEILILDEPTSNLDPRQRRNLIDLLKNIEAAKIIASHDLEMIKELCPRVVFMNGGAIVTEGETLDILSNAALLEKHGLI